MAELIHDSKLKDVLVQRVSDVHRAVQSQEGGFTHFQVSFKQNLTKFFVIVVRIYFHLIICPCDNTAGTNT